MTVIMLRMRERNSQKNEPSYRKGKGKVDALLGGLELPKSNVDGNSSLSLGLKFVKNPSVLEGSLTELGGLLLEL